MLAERKASFTTAWLLATVAACTPRLKVMGEPMRMLGSAVVWRRRRSPSRVTLIVSGPLVWPVWLMVITRSITTESPGVMVNGDRVDGPLWVVTVTKLKELRTALDQVPLDVTEGVSPTKA